MTVALCRPHEHEWTLPAQCGVSHAVCRVSRFNLFESSALELCLPAAAAFDEPLRRLAPRLLCRGTDLSRTAEHRLGDHGKARSLAGGDTPAADLVQPD